LEAKGTFRSEIKRKEKKIGPGCFAKISEIEAMQIPLCFEAKKS
jgi:hypothetical protein